VGPGQRECFFEHVKENFIIDIEYQVIDGGHGDLDINFDLSVDERVIYADFKKSDNVHRFEQPHKAGEYKFCFDNTISHFNSKTVFFELLLEDPDNPQDDSQISELQGLTPEEFYDMKVQDILDSIILINGRIRKSRQLQDQLRSFEARDRNLAELNNGRVSLFSILICLTMCSVGFLQVFMIRNLFETNQKSLRIWDKLGNIIKH
jgi:p24 family protein gamma-2